MYQHLPMEDHPKFTQIGILGLKIYAIWQPCLWAEFSLTSEGTFVSQSRVTRCVFENIA
jgi:hypothetical protein